MGSGYATPTKMLLLARVESTIGSVLTSVLWGLHMSAESTSATAAPPPSSRPCSRPPPRKRQGTEARPTRPPLLPPPPLGVASNQITSQSQENLPLKEGRGGSSGGLMQSFVDPTTVPLSTWAHQQNFLTTQPCSSPSGRDGPCRDQLAIWIYEVGSPAQGYVGNLLLGGDHLFTTNTSLHSPFTQLMARLAFAAGGPTRKRGPTRASSPKSRLE